MTGIVEITLDGDTVELRCTPWAMRELCQKHGDLTTVFRRVQALDFFAMTDVIQAGIGPKILKEMKVGREKLEAAVYDVGMASLTEPVTKFLVMLLNGGKEPKPAGEDDEGGASDEGASGND